MAAKVEAFVRALPPQPDSQRLALARALREASRAIRRDAAIDKDRIR
jgi:hypothetical protein